MITVIIVAYNEELRIRSIIGELQKQQFSYEYEIILADGGSTDKTISLAWQEGINIINCRRGKSCQMNDAAKAARGDILFFVHADMKLAENTLTVIQKHIDLGYDGGGFANLFDEYNDKIKNIGTWMNFRFFTKIEQSDKGIFYGDNGIFVKRNVLDNLLGFKEIPIMEDYDFSRRMRQNFKVIKIKQPPIIISARRHIKAGFFKTRFQWIAIRRLYQCGVSPKMLARLYGDVR
jgi:glycosyltransferase involved in cell wall biosynthesis